MLIILSLQCANPNACPVSNMMLSCELPFSMRSLVESTCKLTLYGGLPEMFIINCELMSFRRMISHLSTISRGHLRSNLRYRDNLCLPYFPQGHRDNRNNLCNLLYLASQSTYSLYFPLAKLAQIFRWHQAVA